MKRRSVAAAALALLTVLSGCAGFTASQTPTVTPAPVPEGSTGETAAQELAPGLTENGIENALQLSTAHFSLLQRGSYTAHSERTVRGTDGTLWLERRETIRVGSGGETHRDVELGGSSTAGDPSRVESWRNRTLLLVAITRDGETTYDGRSSGAYGKRLYGVRETVPASQQLFSLLQSLETDTVGRTANGSYRVRGTGIADRQQFEGLIMGTDARNVSFEAVVTADGLIRSYELRYEADRADGTVRVVRRLRHRDVGTTTVERPPWYGEALNTADLNGTGGQ